MKIGILSDCLGLGFEGGILKAAQMGVNGVQLYAVEGELAPENMSREKRVRRSAPCAEIWATAALPLPSATRKRSPIRRRSWIWRWIWTAAW